MDVTDLPAAVQDVAGGRALLMLGLGAAGPVLLLLAWAARRGLLRPAEA